MRNDLQAPADRAVALASAGRVAEGLAVLEAAAANDGRACLTLAAWRLSGEYIRRDLALSRDLFGRAAAAGNAEAASIHAAFLANGTGGERDWKGALRILAKQGSADPGVRRQLDLIGKMALTDDGEPLDLPAPRQVSQSPNVVLFPSFLTAEESAWLADAAAPLFLPSTVVDPATGRQIHNPVRTSEVAGFPLALESPAIHAINRRIAAVSATDAAQGEPIQILRYRPGQEYKPHFDALPYGDNQRILTMLIYLNEDYEGGETRFLSAGFEVRGNKGDALLFANALADGRPDPASGHAGLPVTRGVKLLASRWIRAKPLDLTGPPRSVG